eukprot:TRINITY_DN3421_c0_g1_i1.p1 TRINITY_DN3421_c0_g1~~TRINITY_DN3421_c0_g1_i1.p1  ORF type:complete len:285 (-),score=105.98 TRINITY_DN3421_c0_g1_i1:152-1006(-)
MDLFDKLVQNMEENTKTINKVKKVETPQQIFQKRIIKEREQFMMKVDKKLDEFIKQNEHPSLRYPPLPGHLRSILHEIAEEKGLVTHSFVVPNTNDKFIMVYKEEPENIEEMKLKFKGIDKQASIEAAQKDIRERELQRQKKLEIQRKQKILKKRKLEENNQVFVAAKLDKRWSDFEKEQYGQGYFEAKKRRKLNQDKEVVIFNVNLQKIDNDKTDLTNDDDNNNNNNTNTNNNNNNNDDDNNDENENENNQNDQLLSVAEQREERRKLLLKAAELRKSKLKIK